MGGDRVIEDRDGFYRPLAEPPEPPDPCPHARVEEQAVMLPAAGWVRVCMDCGEELDGPVEELPA